jgi:hypothetical protein
MHGKVSRKDKGRPGRGAKIEGTPPPRIIDPEKTLREIAAIRELQVGVPRDSRLKTPRGR